MHVSSQTIRDAVTVCRAIDIQWLWVDVLCIIQDDPVDKSQEIVRMGDIFRSATLTLVAATASSSEKGFLNSTFSEVCQPFQRFTYPCPDGKTGFIYLLKHPPGQEIFAIERRGWTMQERLLSTCLLFFSPGRVDWVCRACHLYAGASGSLSVNLIDDTLTEGSRTVSRH